MSEFVDTACKVILWTFSFMLIAFVVTAIWDWKYGPKIPYDPDDEASKNDEQRNEDDSKK